MEVKFHEDSTPANTTIFTCAGDEVLKITPEGFWVRGTKVEQGPKEAQEVYHAFNQWLMWTRLNEPRY